MLAKWINLKYVNFSNIFIGRLKEDLPISLKLMIDAIIGKPIEHFDVSHNAFGPQGVASFEHFLAQASHLKYLDVSNCGLSPVGGQMIAKGLMTCQDMKLREFHGTRSRLEEEGIEALAEVFKNQGCLQKIDVCQNGSKRGLIALLDSMVACKDTLTHLVINDNKSINKAIPQLNSCIRECLNLRELNISDLNMRKRHFESVTASIAEALEQGSKIETLSWNYDLGASHSSAKIFLERLGKIEKTNLKLIRLLGVF